MTAGELCTRRVVVVQKGETVVQAAQRMRAEHVGTVVVVEERPNGERVPVGILTDRDLVVGVLAISPQLVETLLVGDVVVDQLVTAREDEPIYDVIERMRYQGIRRIPVVSASGALVGILAFDDLVEYIAEEMDDLVTLLKREHKREETVRAEP